MKSTLFNLFPDNCPKPWKQTEKGGLCLCKNRLFSALWLQLTGGCLSVDLFVVVDGMRDALSGDHGILELLDKHGFLFKRLVLFEKVLQF